MATLTPTRPTDLHLEPPHRPDERAVIRRGGLAALGGAAALFGAFATYPIFDLPSPDGIESLTTYPDIATGRIIENSLYLAAVVLWAVHFLAIGRAVRNPSTGARPLAPSVGVFGLTVLAAGALIHIATSELSDLYIEPAATAAEQANIVLAWQTSQAIFDTLLVTGAAIVPLAMIAVSWSLIRTHVVDRLSGGVALALGIVGSVGGAAGVIAGPGSPGVPVAMLAMFGFHAVIGWRLSRPER